ncbi:MAG: lamin tail domain-containing protein [Bacteroidia bacterium]|nr:lamin tail domain-containing protein [Bacteroidia bacterium]
MTTTFRLLSLVALSVCMIAAHAQVSFGTADTTYVWQDKKNQFSISADYSAAFLVAEEGTSPATLSTQDFSPSDVSHWHLHFSMVGTFSAYNYISLFLCANLNDDGSVAKGLCVRLGGTNSKTISLVQINPDGSKTILCESEKSLLRPNYPFSIDIYRRNVDNGALPNQYYFDIYCDITNVNELVCNSKDKPIPANYLADYSTTAIEVVFTKTYAKNKTLITDFKIDFYDEQGGSPSTPIEPEPTPEPKPEPLPEPNPEPEPNPSEASLHRGDIVINEIMYHPTDDFGIPEIEWVELHNNTDEYISLSGWTWLYSSAIDPQASIEPNGYIILCAKKYVEDVSTFSNTPVYATSSWPELNNTAKCLFISDNEDNVIDYIYYNTSSFKDSFKSQGGWSLERIDPLNFDGSMSNWHFSTNDILGATPGYKNSIQNTNVDTSSPKCLYATMSDSMENTIRLHFSEPMDTINMPNTISINNSLVSLSLVQANRYAIDWMDIKVEKDIKRETYYELGISDLSDLAGNTIIPTTIKVGYPDSVSNNDIIINEIMSKASPASRDYLELYNRSKKNIDLYSLCVATLNDDNSIKSIYPILPYHLSLFPNEYVVITKDSLGVIEGYNPTNPYAVRYSAKFPALAAEGSVAITSRNGSIVDLCSYNNKMHSPLSKNLPNVSIERIHPSVSSLDISNWTSASQLFNYATPTARNSQYRIPSAPSKEDIEVTTKIFSPTMANKPNCSVISTNFTDASWYATLQVFAPNGYLIATPYNNALLPTTGELTWDGRDTNGQLQAPGTYIVYLSAWQSGGKTVNFKSTVTILAE